MDVPLENQTRESLIALVEAMDKQAKDNEKIRVALENVSETTCAHCQKPHKGMWLECGNCFRIRATLEELHQAVKCLPVQNWHFRYSDYGNIQAALDKLDALTHKDNS